MPLPLNILAPALLAGCFLAGSIPFSLLVGLVKGVDIRTIGSGNVGATNLGRALGRRYFFVGFALDMLKGLIPVLAAGLLLRTAGHVNAPLTHTLTWVCCALAAILGHVFSPWIGFKGGKGVATGLGVLLALYPAMTIPGAAALIVFLCALAASRIVSLSAMVASATVPVWAVATILYFARRDATPDAPVIPPGAWLFVGFSLLLPAIVITTHRANIQRLRAGTEPRIGQRVPTPAAQAPAHPSAGA
ncbi:MAG TPA: glycerol-3-phosphate 1-O-acyltransferase PlsY [Phycisphaerales bacterium]|nr:glycerol-3-phosphate 1-O-acyltransferase PlsY [Phycisphaerales bacterium]